jgi:hypothetical protein
MSDVQNMWPNGLVHSRIGGVEVFEASQRQGLESS